MAGDSVEELAQTDLAQADAAAMAAMMPAETGNILPPALPVLPDVPAAQVDPALLVQTFVPGTAASIAPNLAGQPVPPQPHALRSFAGQPAAVQPGAAAPVTAHERSVQPALSAPQSVVQPAAAQVANSAAPALVTATAVGIVDVAEPAPAATPVAANIKQGVAMELPLTATTQSQLPTPVPTSAQAQSPAAASAVVQPVLAQLLQANPRPAPRKTGDDAVVVPVTAASTVDTPVEAARPATPAPAVPVSPVASVAAASPDIAPAQQIAANSVTAPAAATAPERHDFTAVVDKLAEARELARPGRADMHLAHREFGHVSVQFELAGQALKVAMTSADPGFAPAVQAALAERPVAQAADAARADNQPQRTDSVSASSASWQAGPQADGQRQDGQNRAQQTRTGQGPVRQNEGDADSAGGRTTDRDGSRFA